MANETPPERTTARLAEPVDPPANENQDAWSAEPKRVKKPPLFPKAKAYFALAVTTIVLGGATYLLTSEPEVVEKPITDLDAPLMSDKAFAKYGRPQADSAIECDGEFTGGPKMSINEEGNLSFVVRNQHTAPVLLSFFEEASGDKVHAVGVRSNETEEIFLPANKYTIEALTGSEWCSSEVGFLKGTRINLKGTLAIRDGLSIRMDLVSEGPRPSDFLPRLFESNLSKTKRSIETPGTGDAQDKKAGGNAAKNRMAAQDGQGRKGVDSPAGGKCDATTTPVVSDAFQRVSGGSLALKPRYGNSYFVTGSVNGFPVVFTVDPGSPALVLPQHIAARAGVKSCVQRQIHTTTGNVRGCAAKINDIQFADFRIRNTEALILPTASGDAVLGMNVLSRFKVVQANGEIRINPPLPTGNL